MKTNLYQTLQSLLRQKESVLHRTLTDGLQSHEMVSLFTLSLGLFMGYGLLIGASYNWVQALVSSMKLPLLFLLTAAICFPTLYMFLSYLGIKQGLKQLLGLMLLSLTYISLVLAAFAPVTFFFLITTDGYEFYKFLNIIIFSIAGFIGVRLFYSNIKIVIEDSFSTTPQIENNTGELALSPSPDKSNKARIFIALWAILFATIGTQLSYTLSPFFGKPGIDFILINPNKGNFFKDVLETILNLNL